jgi:glucose-6-phosphate isomerase
MFAGEKINTSERRAVLHVALRAPRGETLRVDGHNVLPAVHHVLDRMGGFAERVRGGQWLGHTGKPVRSVVNIGIGGSDLGPRMACQALRAFSDRGLRMRFVSNIDGAEFTEATRDLNPTETLFVVCSKTWNTQETLTNAATARDWGAGRGRRRHRSDRATLRRGLHQHRRSPGVRHRPPEHVRVLGLGRRPVLPGQRGRAVADARHRAGTLRRDACWFPRRRRALPDRAPIERNIPALMGLLSACYNNFLDARTQAVLPYSHYLAELPAYLQQLEMESNGKHVTLAGQPVDYQTGQVIWGAAGTKGQHAFYQLIHQGTKLVPCDVIGVAAPLSALHDQHDLLLANVFAQTEGLAFGRSATELRDSGCPVEQIAHRVCDGNRPSTTLLLDALTPRSLGTLIGIYEHKVFTEGVAWNIDSFDQWGVELGKILARTIRDELCADDTPDLRHDASTNALIARYRRLRGRST